MSNISCLQAFDANDLEKLKSSGMCTHCDLTMANLDEAYLDQVEIKDSDLSGASLVNVKMATSY